MIFDETNWADEFVNEVKTLGMAASKMSKYRASKTLAEKGKLPVFPCSYRHVVLTLLSAAWKFYEENKQKIGWDLVVLNPTVVSLAKINRYLSTLITRAQVLGVSASALISYIRDIDS